MLIVPLGSTEQHGPQLPLDTDTRIAVAVADALAARLMASGDPGKSTPLEALVAPAITYGSSGEHAGFPGTISIGAPALTMLLVEYGRSAAEWAESIIFVNGHGGNVDALASAVSLLRSEGRDVAWVPCATQAPFVGDAHAGRLETSLILHLAGASVSIDRIETGNDAPLSQLFPRLRTEGVRAVSPNGVLGDPRGATSNEGERIFASMVDEVVARVNAGRVDGRGCLVMSS